MTVPVPPVPFDPELEVIAAGTVLYRVHETILHDAEPGAFIPRVHWQTKVLSALRTTTDISVASDLTDTDATTYPATVRWAEAAWGSGLGGVSYMSRHDNSSKAVCLFTDRLDPTCLVADPEHPENRTFAIPEDAEWLASLALAMRVILRP